MNSSNSNHDPVCGMSVDPATAQHSGVYEGITYYFCAPGCRQQFLTDPKKFLSATEPPTARKRPSIGREVLLAAGIFAAVVIVLVMTRGIARRNVSAKNVSRVNGAAAGEHRAVDGGQGGVITEATHEQKAGDLGFDVSLNTHTVDLTDFNPLKQIKLHTDNREFIPLAAIDKGDRSSHHQNYQLTFPDVGSAKVMLSIHDVAGIGERQLPFSL